MIRVTRRPRVLADFTPPVTIFKPLKGLDEGLEENLRSFFRVTGMLVLLFAAGLLAKGIHEFQEVGYIPTALEHVYDVSSVTLLNPDESTFADFLKGLFGWSPSPSIEMIVAYFAYLIPVGYAFLHRTRGVPATVKPVTIEAEAAA